MVSRGYSVDLLSQRASKSLTTYVEKPLWNSVHEAPKTKQHQIRV